MPTRLEPDAKPLRITLDISLVVVQVHKDVLEQSLDWYYSDRYCCYKSEQIPDLKKSPKKRTNTRRDSHIRSVTSRVEDTLIDT
jgi:hypothetical protein